MHNQWTMASLQDSQRQRRQLADRPSPRPTTREDGETSRAPEDKGKPSRRDSSHPRDLPERTDSSENALPGQEKTVVDSVTSFFAKMRPRNRPERGGTLREPLHDSMDADQRRRRNETDRRKAENRRLSTGSPNSVSADVIPDSRWRTPVAVPQRRWKVGSRTGGMQREGYYSSTQESEMLTAVPILRDGSLPARAASNPIPRRKPVPDHTVNGSRELFLSKQESRHRRRTLKATGDFLGVTGVNPRTGEMDVITPTTSSDEVTTAATGAGQSGTTLDEADLQLARLAECASQAQKEHEAARRDAEQRRHQKQRNRAERHKEAIRAAQQQVKWRREESQWSSVADPGLIPIAQSQGSNTPGPQTSEPATIHPGPDPFLGIGPPALADRSEESPPLSGAGHQPGERFPRENAANLDTSSRTEPENTAAPRPAMTKSVRLRLPFLIPSQRGSRPSNPLPAATQQATEEREEQGTTRETGSVFLALNLETQDPSERWARTLIQDLEGMGHSKEPESIQTAGRTDKTTVRSAYTRTITTTGCEHCQPHGHACGGTPGASDEAAVPTTAISTSFSLMLPPPSAQQPGSTCENWLPSPLPKQRNGWPNLKDPCSNPTVQMVVNGRVVAIVSPVSEGASAGPHGDTISQTAISDGKRGYQSMSRGKQRPQKGMRKTMRKGADVTQQQDIRPPTCTSTCRALAHLSPIRKGESRRGRLEKENLDKAIARGAARTAFVQQTPAATGRVRKSAGLKEKEKRPDDRGGGSNSSGDGGTQNAPCPVGDAQLPAPETGGPTPVTVVMMARVLVIAGRAVSAFWMSVQPAFNAESELRMRLGRGELTWDDCVVVSRAVLFLFLTVIAGAWTGRLIVWTVRGGKAIVQAYVFLAGL